MTVASPFALNPDAQTQVDIFETVHEPLVKAAHRPERRRPYAHARRRDAVEFVDSAGRRQLRRLVVEDVLGH
jgi:hypothetical protein